ncbi:MAG: HDIG domain-containing protein [candidate division KSB1 bacterium]|nr:HDIG domain-containing protein [candidate division KSB1 bacterium]MDZ7405658.1 HDIG domain-containing protein [candidate division KSB1 bacterium]
MTNFQIFKRLVNAPPRKPVDFWQQHRRQFLIAAAFVLAGMFLFPRGKSFQFADLREGEIYEGEQIIAPFTFSINKTSEEYNRDVRAARESVYPVFVRDDSIEAQQLRALADFLAGLEQNLATLLPDSIKLLRLRDFFASQPKFVMSDEGLRFLLHGFARPPRPGLRFDAYAGQLQRIARDVFTVGILNLERSALPAHVQRLSIRQGVDEMVESVEQFVGKEAAKAVALQKLREIPNLSDPAVNIGYQILANFFRPNLFYDERETQQRMNEAGDKVPRARGAVLAKERIIDSHDKITAEHLQKLRSLTAEMVQRRASEGRLSWLLPILGRAAILLIGVGLIGYFLFLARPQIYGDPQRVLLIAIILLLVLFIAYLINFFGLSEYLIPVAIAPMLLIFFFDVPVAFVGTVALGILLGSMRGYEFNTIFITLVIGLFSILAVRRVRSRRWIFKAILLLAAGYLSAIAATAFLRFTPFPQVLVNLRDGILINALLCPIFTYGLMVIFEYLFDLTTDATLLELSALNRPLLRELALQAPGTYHHSIVVGTLSEAAAEAIGANSLLARVGAYYHDIGKTEMAEYFVENQRGGKNPHEKLTPYMSLLVIVNHVKRGLEIAEENNIPKEVRDFIPQHHGTNLISYFYKKALERNEDSEVHESDFRYPGPKPQTKETGIVMLADAVEAACRSLRDPSISRLRNMVNSIVEDRFKKGELDECPLTLRDLNLIKESFIRTLTGIFHGRTQYSEDQKAAGENATSPPGQSGGPPHKAQPSGRPGRPPSQAAGEDPEAPPRHPAASRASARRLGKNHSDQAPRRPATASENPVVDTTLDSSPAIDES